MPNEQRDKEPTTDKPRDASAAERIDKRRDADRELDRREDEAYSDPESSAQKTPPGGPQP